MAYHTLRRHDNSLRLFMEFLQATGIPVGDLAYDEAAWSAITRKMVEDFIAWQVTRGYALSSVNVQVNSIRVFARLGYFMGTVEWSTFWSIIGVAGIHSQRDYLWLLARCKFIRPSWPQFHENQRLRPTRISTTQAHALKTQPDTPQGHRDGLLMCLLLDQGLTLKQVHLLRREDFNLDSGTLLIGDDRGGNLRIIHLTDDTLWAAKAYLTGDAPGRGRIWRGSRKGNFGLTDDPWSDRSMTGRIRLLGEKVSLGLLRVRHCQQYWQAGRLPFSSQE
jgi:hypothetical protein